MNRVKRLVTPILLVVVAGAIRLLSWHSVFQEGAVYPNGNDAYYHLQRIRYTVENFPEVLRFDPLMNFPAGAQSIWPPTFDWLIAALVRVLPGLGQPDSIDRYAVCIPPILGVLTVLLVYRLGIRFFSRTVGFAAALSMAILPAHALYSRVGAVDHHVLVAALVVLMLGFAMELVRQKPSGALSAWLPRSIGLGLSMAAAVLVWPGSLLQVGVLQVALVVRLLSARDLDEARGWAMCFAVVHFVAFLVVAPMSLGNTWQIWGPFSPVVLSNFQPIYFLAGALCFGGLAGLWRLGWGAASRPVRAVSAVAIGFVLLVALQIALPDLIGGVRDALSWFTKDEEFQSAVNESVGLFGGDRGQMRASSFFGAFIYVVPIAVGYFAWRLRARAEVLLLLGWGLVLYVATLVQWRFMNSYSIAYCLLIGLVVESVIRAMRPHLIGPLRRTLAVVAAIVVLVFVFLAPLRSYRLHAENFRRSFRGEATVPVGSQLQARFAADAARFLKARSEAVGGASPFGGAASSVLGPWGDGHILKAIGGLAVVQDNFGDDVAPENFARADDYFAARTEADALDILAPMETRYVLVRSTGSGHRQGNYYYKSLFSRLYRLRGNRGALPQIPEHDTRIETPLVHHRLIYQSPRINKKDPQPYIMIFEIVRGAELFGRAPPGTKVEVLLDVAPEEGKRFLYSNSIEANANGVYWFRLPYSNEALDSNVRVGPKYFVRIKGERSTVVIPEAAVIEGWRVGGPTFAN